MTKERVCARCGVDITDRDARSRHCSSRCRDRDYEGAAVGTVRKCRLCDADFAATRGTHVYCSRTCRARSDVIRNRASYNARNAERRARERGAQVGETFTRVEIFDRDGWICQPCLAPIDWTMSGRGRFAPALDHIVPLNAGGAHERSNAQAAHSGCNARKRDRLDVILLPVPGCA